MAIPSCENLAVVSYFTNLALEFGKAGNTLWNFHIIVTAAVLGWAISSRNWNRGLPWAICIAIGAGLAVFHALNLVSVASMYGRANDAIDFARDYWRRCDFAPPALFQRLSYFGIAINLVLDIIVCGVVVLMLSPWRREPSSSS